VSRASAWLALERINLVRACLFAAENGWERQAVAMALVLRPVLDGGHDEDAKAVHSAALGSALRLDEACDMTDRAGIRTGLGIANWRLGRHEEAVEQLQVACDEHLAAGNAGGAALTLAALGLVFDARGQYRQAIECQGRGLQIARAAGVRIQEAVQLINLGYGHLRIEEYQVAADLCRRALEIFAGEGEPLGEAQARAGLAAALEGLGQYDDGLAQAEESVATNRSFSHAVYRLRAMATIGSIQRRLGRLDDARERLTEALRECRELNNPRPTANLLNTLGETCQSSGDYPAALANHAEALTLSDRCGDQFEHTRALVGLGDTHAAAGEPALARQYWQRAYDVYTTSGVPAAARVRARLAVVVG
jgi:tetratricopeptide (TPR) repeat protein